jgi:hypothetical protein
MRSSAMYKVVALLLVWSLAGVLSFGQSLPGTESLAQLKKETRILESVIEEILRQNFDHPYAIAAGPKAAYLRDYGVTVSFHLKINRGTIRTLFGETASPLVNAPGSKEKQVQTVRSSMIDALADYGDTLKKLNGTDRIAICAHIEDRNELDQSKNRSILVVSARKGDIEKFSTKSITLEEFRSRTDVIQY